MKYAMNNKCSTEEYSYILAQNKIWYLSFLLFLLCFYSCRWWSVFRILYNSKSWNYQVLIKTFSINK